MTTHEQSITMDLQAEIDQLRQENAELNKLASLKLSRSRIRELQAGNARLNSEKAEVVRGFDLVQAQYQSTKKALALQGEEIDRLKAELAAWQSTCGTRQNHIEDVEKLKAENARLSEIAVRSDEVIDELSHHWSTHRNEFDRFDLVQQRITELRESRESALRDLLAPTIELLQDEGQKAIDSGWHQRAIRLGTELARLRMNAGFRSTPNPSGNH